MNSAFTRRGILKTSLLTGLAFSAGPLLARRASAAGGTVNFADIGVGDPDGDWSRFTGPTGY
jgi:putative spermidine/putrescine transport system substrate-binding protein